MKRKDYLYIFLLIMIPLLFLFIITSQNLLFGNKVDWFNQHITIADALRHAIREEGTIFPTYLSHLMSGVNIYYFSYYGSLRFDVLLGALFINVKMIDLFIGYQVFLLILTNLTCYFFLKEHLKRNDLCFLLSLFVLLSSIFFQFHKQVMFVCAIIHQIPLTFYNFGSVLFYIVIFIVLLVLLFVLFISLCNVPIIKNIRNLYFIY